MKAKLFKIQYILTIIRPLHEHVFAVYALGMAY